MDVKPEIGARRIRLDKRQEEKAKSDKESLRLLRARFNSDLKRYKKYYGLNPYDKNQQDFVIDTSNLTVEQTIPQILAFLETRIHKA